MGRVLITWELGGGLGHLLCLKPLIKRLQSCGLELFLTVRDVANAKDVYSDTEITILQSPIHRSSALSPFRDARSFAELLLAEGFADRDDLYSRCLAWREIVARIDPDFILFDHAPTAILAVRGIDIRTATFGNGFFVPPLISPTPDLRPWLPPDPERTIQSEQIAVTHCNHVLSRFRSPTISGIGNLYAGIDEHFLTTFRELDHFSQRTNGRYYGIPPAGVGVPPCWPDGVGKRIFAYLQPSPFTLELFKQIALLRMPSIVFAPGVSPDLVDYCRSNFPQIRIETEPVDLSAVSKQCDVVVHHGTHNTAATFLLAGIPALICPIHLEHRLTGMMIQELGAAHVVDPYDTSKIINGLHQLLVSTAISQCAQEFASRYQRCSAIKNMDCIAERILKNDK
ncbi:glycosyltransferase [Neorhodopirellula pilleata]|uniref:MurG-like transferase n=1 Tax=Neorhodopirellula pilleata TaxID=2714738 RepID=A0A5C6AGG9_9BACT|nr:nucleotide disphospho-sugar-binding domain-containing protein [Neorhodopirellula pilleata]TWT99064.1 hypothetical protein Pla100_22400 [Neorhodopirellula pilleata]